MAADMILAMHLRDKGRNKVLEIVDCITADTLSYGDIIEVEDWTGNKSLQEIVSVEDRGADLLITTENDVEVPYGPFELVNIYK